MSDDAAREFLHHLAQDQELQRRISSEATDRAAALALTIRLANEAGFEVDAPPMEQALGELAAAASGGEDGLVLQGVSRSRISSFRPVLKLFEFRSKGGIRGGVGPCT